VHLLELVAGFVFAILEETESLVSISNIKKISLHQNEKDAMI